MSDAIRTERTHGTGEDLTEVERGALMQLRYTPGYQVLLDMMERACISQETKLINAEVDEPETILAEHRMSKAFWQVFQSMQKQVEREVAIHLGFEQERKEKKQEAENFEPDQDILGVYDVRERSDE